MDCRLSVIVPVYNAEKTLRRCVDSLRPQMREGDELILVNDGSKDGSAALCAQYAAQDARIRYVSKGNGGVSSARNAGLDVAKGTCVLFVDSDDYVPSSLFADIDRELQAGDWDLLRFSYCVDNGKAAQEIRMVPAFCRSRADALPRIIDDICSKTLNPPWAKLYRRDVIERENIRFPLGVSIAEDRAFNIKYSMYVQQYRITDRIGYFVNTENEQSLSRKQHRDLNAQFAITGEYVQQAIREATIPETEKEAYRRAVNFGVCRSIYKDAKDLRRDEPNWFQRQKFLWKRCGEINRQHMKYPNSDYCRIITLPVRFRATVVIDLIAKRLLK